MRYLGTLFLLTLVFAWSGNEAQASNDTKTEQTQNQRSISEKTLLTWSDITKQDPHKQATETSFNGEHVPSEKDKLLNRWKEKQAKLWDSLPREAFTVNVSAYTAALDECGKSDGITASGVSVSENRTLACPSQYPFGAQIHIEGYGTYVCEDRGGAITGNRFDIYMKTKKEAFTFGRRELLAQVIR